MMYLRIIILICATTLLFVSEPLEAQVKITDGSDHNPLTVDLKGVVNKGFFIHVTDGTWPVTGSMMITNQARVTDSVTFLLKSSQAVPVSMVRLAAGYSDDSVSYDPMVVYYDDNATFNFDGQYDALKLFNTDAAVTNFYAFSADSSKLSIDGIPFPAEGQATIRLGLKTARSGEVEFKILYEQGFCENQSICLYDVETGKSTCLKNGISCKIILQAGHYEDRFYLNVSDLTTKIPEYLPSKEKLTAYASRGMIKTDVEIDCSEPATLQIFDMNGRILKIQKIPCSGHYDIEAPDCKGILILRLLSCKIAISRKILVL